MNAQRKYLPDCETTVLGMLKGQTRESLKELSENLKGLTEIFKEENKERKY